MANITGSVEEREEVRELWARYAYALDHGDIDGWLNCFTEDGVMESARLGRFEGHVGLRKFAGGIPETRSGAQIRHLCTNQIMDLDGDQGTGSCYFMYFDCKNQNIQQVTVGEYRDVLKRVDGRWKIKHRRVELYGHR